MTATGDAPTNIEGSPDPAPSDPDAPPERIHQVCPYLQGEGGGWRSLQPTRDHRCAAMQPPAEPAVVKQRDLCLQPPTLVCDLPGRARPRGRRRSGPAGRRRPVAGHQAVGARPRARPRQRGVAASRCRPHGRPGAARGAHGAGLPRARRRPDHAVGRRVAGASLAAAAGASQPIASAAPASPGSVTAGCSIRVPGSIDAPPPVRPRPVGVGSVDDAESGAVRHPATTYTVKAGDTLSSIAIAHGVTVKQLRKANGLDGNVIRAGQELVIP